MVAGLDLSQAVDTTGTAVETPIATATSNITSITLARTPTTTFTNTFTPQAVAARFSSPAMAWFPWKTLSLLLLIGTAAVVRLDLQRAGGDFRRSSTGQLLADAGQYERASGGAAWCLEQGGRGRGWAEETIPPYWLHANKVGRPYLDLATLKLGEAGELASLGLTKTRVLARQGMVKLEEALPGAGARLEEAQVAATKWGVLVAARARSAGVAAREGALLLVR